MKGLMVALLTIGLTGMVSGQQPQNSSNGFGGQSNSRNGSQGNSQFQRIAQNPSTANTGSNQNDGSNSRSQSANSATAERFGPLQIGFRETDFDAFKRAGEMSSPIGTSDVASVNSVIFFHEKFADQQATLGDSFGRLEPVSRDSGILIFELDDLDLDQIRTQGMRYNYSAQERGFYNTIKAIYRPSRLSTQQQQQTTRREPAQTDNRRVDSTRLTPLENGSNNNQSFGNSNYPLNRFASNDFNGGATQQNSQQQSNFNPNVPREYDRNFMGPTRPPTNNNSNFVVSNPNNGFDNGLSPRRTTQYDLPGSNQNQSNLSGNSNVNSFDNPTGWSPIPNRGNQVSTRMGGSLNEFGNNSNYQPTDNRGFNSLQPGQQEYNPRTTNQNDSNQIAVCAPGSQIADNRNLNYNSQNQFGLSNLELEQRQIAFLKAKAMEEKLALEKRELADLEQANFLRQKSLYQQQQLQQQQQQTDNQWAGNNQRRPYETSGNSFNQFDNGPPEDRPGYTPTGGYSYSDRLTNNNGYGAPPDRYAANGSLPQPSGNSISDYSASVPGPGNVNNGGAPNAGAPNGRGNNLNQSSLMGDTNAVSMEGPMFFMLICSLGLNIYLGWISRSFYVRYNELADELRETFTASL